MRTPPALARAVLFLRMWEVLSPFREEFALARSEGKFINEPVVH
jgi:hypothetical protein